MKYKLISIHYWNKSINVLMQSDDINLLFNRYCMIVKYKKYLNTCPKTKLERFNYRNIENKLLKELHLNECNNEIFGKLMTHHIAVQESLTGKVMSIKRFFTLSSGFIPSDKDVNDEYKKESIEVNGLLTHDWQSLNSIKSDFKFYNREKY